MLKFSLLEEECRHTVDRYKQELNMSRERVLELMEECQRYEQEVFMLRADKKRMKLEIGDFENRQRVAEGKVILLIMLLLTIFVGISSES